MDNKGIREKYIGIKENTDYTAMRVNNDTNKR